METDSFLDPPVPNSIAELFWDPEWKTPLERPGMIEGVDGSTTYATSHGGGWRFLRLRRDKLTPNDVRVISNINQIHRKWLHPG